MKRIELSQGKFAIVDEEDFAWLNKWKWHFHRNPKDRGGYAIRNRQTICPRGRVGMHREILNAKKGQIVDHINRDTLDNRRSNLRIASRSESSYNKDVARVNKSCGFKGVSIVKDKRGAPSYWITRISVKGKRIYLGVFSSSELANQAYIKASKKLHKKFSYAWS